MSTVNDMIQQTLGTLGEPDAFSEPVEPTALHKVASTHVTELDIDGIEKLASVLELLGTRGISSFTEKTAGKMSDDALSRVSGSADVGDVGPKGTTHPALASAESVAAVTKKEKARMMTPALKKVLNHAPFADSSHKHLLTHRETDKNINKTAHDVSAIRAELARRASNSSGE